MKQTIDQWSSAAPVVAPCCIIDLGGLTAWIHWLLSSNPAKVAVTGCGLDNVGHTDDAGMIAALGTRPAVLVTSSFILFSRPIR